MRALLILMLLLVSCQHQEARKPTRTKIKIVRAPTIVNYYNNYEEGEGDPLFKSSAQIIIEEEDVRAAGTGFAYKNVNNNTYFITVAHLCERRGRRVEVIPPPFEKKRETFPGKVVYVNKKDDVCIVRAYDTKKQFLPVRFAKTIPKIGDKVATIGAAEGLFPSKTEGYVVGHDMMTAMGIESDTTKVKVLLTTIPASHGNSGGPVYNTKHEVVGMLVATHIEYPHSTMSVPLPIIKKHIKKYFKRK